MGKEATVMVGGHGQNSYMHNSIHQRTRYDTVANMVEEVIHERLHIPTKGGTIRVADLGCSVGPNTLHSMRTVLDAIGAKIKRSSSSQDQDHGRSYEFLVSFNDRIGNDFNTLFEFLPPNRQYFVAAVPGSFYSRLFPQNSVHYFNSSLALHWLSRAPSGLVNKGRVHCHGGGAEAVAAYGGQFRADMAAFLEARAVELVPGGLLVMLFVCRHEWMDADAPRHDMWFPHIESILRELVAEGCTWMISELRVLAFQEIVSRRTTDREEGNAHYVLGPFRSGEVACILRYISSHEPRVHTVHTSYALQFAGQQPRVCVHSSLGSGVSRHLKRPLLHALLRLQVLQEQVQHPIDLLLCQVLFL